MFFRFALGVVTDHGLDGRRELLASARLRGRPSSQGRSTVLAQNARVSTVTLFVVPRCRPPVFCPFAI
jgi:hypothetical protein